MNRRHMLLPVLLLGASWTGHAFTLDIASSEISDSGQGPNSIFIPGYGEVVFESGLDGALVVDSAYASTDRIEVPPSSKIPDSEPPVDGAAAGGNPSFVKISNRIDTAPLPIPQVPTLQPVDDSLKKPPGGWNTVPEAASAALGLIGTLMLLLRRRVKAVSTGSGMS